MVCVCENSLGHVFRIHAHHVGEVLLPQLELRLLPHQEHVMLPLPETQHIKIIVHNWYFS
jgi:hypothetical protein